MATAGTNWRLANSLIKLREQINAAHPNRSRASDGTVGDLAHQQQGSASEHNPNAQGVVCAFDITNDPANGMDVQKLADSIAASRDGRIKYMIFNDRIMIPNDYGWVWRFHYAGSHRSHLHVSVWNDYDNITNWKIGDNEMLDAEGAKEVYRLGLHREPENDEVWKPLVGKSFAEVSRQFRISNEWLGQNHVTLLGYAAVQRERDAASDRINELQKQLTDTQAKLAQAETLATVPNTTQPATTTPPETGTPGEPIDTQKVNWLVRILINLFNKKA